MNFRDALKEYRELQGTQATSSAQKTFIPESSGGGTSDSSFRDSLKKYREKTSTVSLDGWAETSINLIKDVQNNSVSWQNKNEYQSRYDQLTNLLGTADKWRKQYAGNREAISYIDSVVSALEKTQSYNFNNHRYFSQFETEEDYQKALRAYGYQEKYNGKSYKDIQTILSTMSDGEEKSWLSGHAYNVKTANDYDDEIGGMNTQIKPLEESLAEMTARRDELQRLSIGYSRSNNIPKARIDAVNKELKQVNASIKEAEAQLEAMKGQKWTLENEREYRFLNQNEDFAKNSKVAHDEATAGFGIGFGTGWWGEGDPLYDYINNLEGTRKGYMTDMESSNPYYIYDQMNRDEIATYNYLYNTDGKGSADKYLDYLEYTLNQRVAGVAKENAAMFADRAPVLASALSVPANLVSGIGAIDVAGQNIVKGLKESFTGEYAGPVDYNRGAMTPTMFTTTVRGTVAQNIADSTGTINLNPDEHPLLSQILNGKSLGDVYQLGMSMADSAAVAMLSPYIGTAGTYLLGGSAASQGILDAVARGATDEQALTMGILNGAFEMLFEKYSLENLLNGDTKGIIKNFLKQGFVEGSEEFNTTLANNIADLIVMAEKSSYKQSIAAYMKQGLSEEDATKQALLDMAIQLGWDFVGGMASGGIMGSISKPIMNTLQKNADAEAIYGADPGALVAEALEIDPSYGYAQRMNKRVEAGKDLSGKQLRRMVDHNEQTLVKQDMSAIQDAAVQRLTELGETGNVDAIGAVLAKQAAGKNLSKVEKQTIASSKYAQRVANELNTDNIRSGGYSSAWAENLDTQRINPKEYSRLVEAAQQPHESAQQPRKAAETTGGQVVTDTPGETQAPKAAPVEPKAATVAENTTVPANDQQVTSKLTADEPSAVAEESSVVEKKQEKPVTLEEASQKYGAQAKAMIHTYQPGQDVAKFDKAYQAAYDMGRSGVNIDYALKSESTGYLTDSQKELAYNTGKDAADAKANAKDAANKAAANGKTGWKKGGVVRGEGVTIADLKKVFNDPRGKAYKILSTIAKATGVNIVLYKSQTDENGNFIGEEGEGEQGKFDPDNPNEIRIDIYAGLENISEVEDLERYVLLRTFSHEFTHFIEKWNPIRYNEFRKVVFDELTKRGKDVNQLIELKMKATGLGYEAASRDVVADAMTDILPDSSFVQQLAEKHQTIFQKLLAKLKEFVQNLREYFDSIVGNDDYAANALKDQVGDSVKYMESIVQMWDQIAVEAVENYQATVATEEVVVSKNENTTTVSKTETVEETETKTETTVKESETKVEETETKVEEKPVETKQPVTETDAYGFTITDNVERGSLEISFDSKPSDEVRHVLKENKFRWHKGKKVWFGYTDRKTITDALHAAYESETTVSTKSQSMQHESEDSLVPATAAIKAKAEDTALVYGSDTLATIPFMDREYVVQHKSNGTYTVSVVGKGSGFVANDMSKDGFSSFTEASEYAIRWILANDQTFKTKWPKAYAELMGTSVGEPVTTAEADNITEAAYEAEAKPEESASKTPEKAVVKNQTLGLPVVENVPASSVGGIVWSADDVVTKTDRDYAYKTIDAAIVGRDLFFRFRGTYKTNPRKQMFFVIRSFKDYTANEIFTDLINRHKGSNPYPLGRHFEDIVRTIYKNEGLSQGSYLKHLHDVAEKPKEVTDNGKESETGPDTRAVHEPVRGSEGSARLLEGVEPETVRGSDEGREPVQSGSDQGAGDAGRDRRTDAAGPVSERSTRDRVGGDLQQLPAVTETETDTNVGDKTAEDTNVPSKKAEQLHEEVQQQIEQKSTVNPKGSNFVIGDSLNLPSGTKARTRANIEAIKLVKQIAADGRIATPAEQEILSKYVGWGGLADAFGKPVNNYTTRKIEYEAVKGLEAEFEELKSVLTEEEYKTARESTKNAHYTSIEVVKAMYDGLKQLGFTGGRMLEPSSGVGNFVGAMPADMTAQVKSWTMVELDHITGLFAKYLYPNADVRIQGFEQANIPDGYMDVAIGNVPFGNYAITDKHYPKAVTSAIHNYFFAKSLDKVRTGGIVMFITSSYTMNGKDNAVRKYIMQRADLLGAIRLPNTAFSANAGTPVVTDILILKKRADRTEYAGEAFQESKFKTVGSGWDGAYVNEYFTAHPEMVLGTPKLTRGMHSANELTYDPFKDRGSLGDQIREAMKNIQGKMDYATQLSAEKANFRQASAKKKRQKLQVKDGVIQAKDENGNITKVDVDKDTAARITGMVAIRDAHVALCDALQQGVNKKESASLRKALNKAYDSFVEKYGYLNSPKNKKAIKEFADRYSILSLENYRTEGRKVIAEKSDIFTKDTIAANRTASSAENVEEGLTISLNTVGVVDVAMIARLTGQNADSVTRQLIDQRLVFKDRDGNLIPAAQYLSGNVRAKLREMEGLTGIDRDYQNNVEALRKVVPPTVAHTDIYVNPGANWVPVNVYEDFVGYILKRQNYTAYRTGKKDFSVEYVPETNEYKVSINDSYAKMSAQNTQVWGESGKAFSTIFENMLNGRRTNVYKDNGDGTRVLDKAKTEAVAEKVEKLNEEFRKWLWEDEARRGEMQELYNETYNALVTPKYSGASLTVNGLNSEYTLRDHQKDAVARIINSGGNTLLAHRVGAGKTMEMAAAAMKLKQLGVIKKPMFVVPNNVVAQWGKEFRDYFPAANILVVGDDDMTAAERMTTINRIKNNDYDAVILAYTKFEKIQMTTAWRQKFYEEQIDSIMFALNAEKESQGGKGFTVKQLMTKRKQLEAKLKKLTDKAKDEDGAMFEDLGVDSLFVDEAHNFKNLEYSTRMSNVSGLGEAEGAQRSFDLYTKVRYLQQLNGGRGVVFATATPVMNSMTEMYIMQRYLQPDTLKQLGIEHFDAWAKMFGEVVNALEIAPSGSGYRLKQTFSKFKNVKALQQLFRSFTDVLTDVPGLKIPKMNGGKVQIVECEQSEFQKNYMADLAKRAENVKNVDPSEDNMLKITSDGRKISYSQRMIDPSLPYEETGKIYKCCENVYAVYQESNKTKGTQMIFCDMATPKGKSSTKNDSDTNTDEFAAVDAESAQLYDDMKSRLVQMGIPAKEIAFIHDAKNDKQKAELSEKMNNGTIRVLIGSTGKMGVGLNAQKKAVAIHHLDAPWRPGDIEQRDGRVFRQKNENEEAYKFVYVTRGSFDSRLWDILDRKQKFINQVMNGEDVGNEIEDTGEVTLSAAEVKAVASDNPLIMEQVALEKEISKLQSLQQAHRAGVSRAQEKMAADRRNIALLERLIANGQEDISNRKDTYSSDKVFSIQIGTQTFTDKKDAGTALVAAAEAKAKEGDYTSIGKFAGFDMRVVKTQEGVKGVLSGAGNYEFKTYPLSPTNGINHLISVVNGIDERLAHWNKNLSEAKNDLETQKQLAAEPFEQAEKLKQKRIRYNEVMDILNPPKEQQNLDTDGGDTVQYQRRTAISDDVQYQQRTHALTDLEVLELALEKVDVSDLSDKEKNSIDILQKRLVKLKELQDKRYEQGQLYNKQQFGAKVDRAEAAKTLNRMKVLDSQIQKASAEVLSVEEKTVLKRVLQKARKVVENQQWDKDQETLKRWRDRRNNADAIKKYRDRLRGDVDELTNWVLHPDNKSQVKHIPDALKNTVIPFLSSINFESKRSLAGGNPTKADKAMMDTARKLAKVMENTGDVDELYTNYTDLPPDFMTNLRNFMDTAQEIIDNNSGDFVINQMTAEELKNLSKVVRTLKKYIVQMNRFHVNAMFQHVDDAGNNSMDFMDKLKPAENTGTVSQFLLWQQMRPAYAFERFGEGGMAIYDGLRRGQAKLAFNTNVITKFSEKAYTEAEVKAWENEVKTITINPTTVVKMRVSQIMSLYELSKREQAKGHILGDGIRVATFKNGRKKISDVGHKLTQGELNTILNVLTTRQKEVADNLQQFMQKQGGEWGNYVTVARFGEKQFGEENYFPINSDGRHLSVDADEKPGAASLYALLNMGFTKQTQEKAKNRIIVYSIFDVFANHMASMAQYNAFALPIVDALKWFNYQTVETDDKGNKMITGSVREQMDRAFGVPEETRPGSGRQGYAQNFVINIIKALNGTEAQGVPTDAFGVEALHRYNIAQVAYNLRVVAQQPLAITRAAQLIDYSSIIKGMKLSPAVIKKNIAEMQEHSGIAAWKALGFYDVNISRGLTDIIKHDKGTIDKINEFGMMGAEIADTLTWAGIWSACKEEVIRKQKLTPKDKGFYDAVTKLFEDVIYKTQVVDSVLTKNEFLRSKGIFARLTGSFMSEPTTTASMLVDAFDKYQMDKQRGMTTNQAWQKNKAMIVRTAYVYGLGAAILAAVQAVADAFRDDDEYETWLEKWLEAFGGNLVDEAMPFNKLPIVSDVYELAKELISIWGVDTYGNPPQSVYMQWYDSLVKGVQILHDKTSGENTNYTWYAGAYKLLQAASGLTGLPMAAATREIITAWNSTIGAMAPSLRVISYESSDSETASALLEALIEGNQKEVDRISAKYEDEDAMHSGLRSAVKSLYLSGDIDKMTARKYLMMHADMDLDDTYWALREWDHVLETGSSDDYRKYGKFYEAVESGKNLDAVIREYTENGVDEQTLRGQITDHFKSIYLDMPAYEKEKLKARLLDALVASGSFLVDAEDIISEWDFEAEHGTSYNEMVADYKDGDFSKEEMKAILINRGLTAEEAEDRMSGWDFEVQYGFSYSSRDKAYKEGNISAAELRTAMIEYGDMTETEADNYIRAYDWQIANPQYNLTVSDVLSYTKPIEALGYSVEDYGIAPNVYVEYKNKASKCKGKDEDGDGRADNNTVKNEKMAVIDALPLSSEQKDALYYLNGWAKSKIYQAPWH